MITKSPLQFFLLTLFSVALTIALTVALSPTAEAKTDHSAHEKKSGKSEKSDKSHKKSAKSYKEKKGKSDKKPKLKITKADFRDKTGELGVKVSTHLPADSVIYLYDADSGALLDEQITDGRQARFTITENIACSVRVVSGNLDDAARVKHAPNYCRRDGIAVTLTGTAKISADQAIGFAEVSSELEGYRFTTETDASGYYELTVRGTNPESFVVLSAQGSGNQDWIELKSLIGELGALAGTNIASLEPVGPAQQLIANTISGLMELMIPSASAQLSALESTTLNSLSTALYAILSNANGGTPPTTQAEVDALIDQANPVAIIQLAAAISVLSGPGDLPEGASSLAELVADPLLTQALVDETEPEILQDAIAEITSDPELFPGLEAADIIGESYEAPIGNYGVNQPSGKMTFNPDGTGARLNRFGVQDFSWNIDIDGKLVVAYSPLAETLYLNDVPCVPVDDGAGGTVESCPYLISSTYSQLADTGDARSFSLVHSYAFDDPATPGGTLTSTTSLVSREGLVAIDATSFEGKRFGTYVGALHPLDGYVTNATLVNFYAGGTGLIEGGNITVDTPMSWSIVDGDTLVISYDAANLEGSSSPYSVSYNVLRTFDKALQVFIQAQLPGDLTETFAAGIVEQDVSGYAAGTEVGRYVLSDGPFDATTRIFLLEFGLDAAGSQQFYPDPSDPENCGEQPFLWSVEDGELVAKYYSAFEGFQPLASCPPELEGVTCFQWRERRVTLLAADEKFNYVRNWQQFTNPDGTIDWGPQSYIGVHERLPLEGRCYDYPDAPQPSVYAGDYSMPASYGAITNQTFSVGANGMFEWVFDFGTNPGVRYTGQFDENGFHSNPDFAGFALTFEMTEVGHLAISAIDLNNPQFGPSYQFAARDDLPAVAYAGAYALGGDTTASTERFTVDTAGNVVWNFTFGSAANEITGKLAPDGSLDIPDYAGFKIFIQFDSPSTLTIEVIDPEGNPFNTYPGTRIVY